MSDTPLRRPLPPPLVLPPKGLWRATPPAIFPSILGLFGLGLGLRAAGRLYGLSPLAQAGEALLGALTLLLAFALMAYLGKLLRRPSALFDDLQILPGRAGIGAALGALALASAGLAGYAPSLATALIFITLALQIGLILWLGLRLLRFGLPPRETISSLHLIFVGYALTPFALIELGWLGLARGLILCALASAAVLWSLSLPVARRVSPPLRPVLAINLAPAAVLSSGASLAGWPMLSGALLVWAFVMVMILTPRPLYLFEGGFSPLWGSFTFPLAALAQAALRQTWPPVQALGFVLLTVALVAIPLIAFRILKTWPGGKLAAQTQASVG